MRAPSRFWTSPVGRSAKLRSPAYAITVVLSAALAFLALGAVPAAAAPVHISFPLAFGQQSPNTEFSPNGDLWDDSAQIFYCVDAPADVSTTITNEGSSTVVRRRHTRLRTVHR